MQLRICVANDDERDINRALWAWNVANGVILEYFIWDCWISIWISCSVLSWWWQIHEQRLGFNDKDNIEDDEHISDDENSREDVEQFEEERLASDNDDELWAIRESKEVVERVVRRVVRVVDEDIGDV